MGVLLLVWAATALLSPLWLTGLAGLLPRWAGVLVSGLIGNAAFAMFAAVCATIGTLGGILAVAAWRRGAPWPGPAIAEGIRARRGGSR